MVVSKPKGIFRHVKCLFCLNAYDESAATGSQQLTVIMYLIRTAELTC